MHVDFHGDAHGLAQGVQLHLFDAVRVLEEAHACGLVLRHTCPGDADGGHDVLAVASYFEQELLEYICNSAVAMANSAKVDSEACFKSSTSKRSFAFYPDKDRRIPEQGEHLQT